MTTSDHDLNQKQLAAEEMYLALKEVQACVSPILRDGVRLADAHDKPEEIWPDLCALDRVDAAIAKAEGIEQDRK